MVFPLEKQNPGKECLYLAVEPALKFRLSSLDVSLDSPPSTHATDKAVRYLLR
jgi:hypothetical protein